MVKCHENPFFLRADSEQRIVETPLKILLPNRHRIMAGASQKLQSAPADILVELDPHAASPSGIGMIRSRDISAP